MPGLLSRWLEENGLPNEPARLLDLLNNRLGDAGVAIGRRAGTEITCHAVDLGQPPDRLLAAVAELAGNIAVSRRR